MARTLTLLILAASIACEEPDSAADSEPAGDASAVLDASARPDAPRPEPADAGTREDGGASDGGTDASDPSRSCLPPGDHPRAVNVSGLRHDYVVHVPPARLEDAALIVQLHGGGSTGAAMDAVSQLTRLADREGFVVVTPEGWPARGIGPQVWNAGSCCGPVGQAPDHVAVIAAILDGVAAEDACFDRGRQFATGHSNGGMMAYRLACELSDRLAGVAVSGGALMNRDRSMTPPSVIFSCDPVAPVSILHVHGIEDLCAPYAGGATPGGAVMPPVEEVVAGWRERLNCGPASEAVEGPVRRIEADCRDGSAVELISVEGLGHPWAGSSIYPSRELCGGSTTTAVSTTDELWRFFRNRRR